MKYLAASLRRGEKLQPLPIPRPAHCSLLTPCPCDHDTLHRRLPEIAARVHLYVRRPLEGLPVQTLVGEHPHGPEGEGV